MTEVEQADVVVLVLGADFEFRTASGESVTQQEFRRARPADKRAVTKSVSWTVNLVSGQMCPRSLYLPAQCFSVLSNFGLPTPSVQTRRHSSTCYAFEIGGSRHGRVIFSR
jgi:hypothetical protein